MIMRRRIAMVLGLLLLFLSLGDSSPSYRPVHAEEMAAVMRRILNRSEEPQRVSNGLRLYGARLLAHRESMVNMAEHIESSGQNVALVGGGVKDFTMKVWVYEWQERDGSYREQIWISSLWGKKESRWIDHPQDLIDVRWIVGDLVYSSSIPFDGILRDQHTQGIASFTVADRVGSWDLAINFKPVSKEQHQVWTNIFVNYTHTWLGLKASVTLGSGPTGSTGSLTVNTDAKTWTQGTAVAFEIGAEGMYQANTTRLESRQIGWLERGPL